MRTRRLPVATLVVAALLATVVVVGSSGGSASAIADQSLSGTASSQWQTNNTVYTLATANGVLYAGGSFTAVRPPGAAQGTNETARTYLAAFNTSTGALITSFNVTLNGQVRALAVSPDGGSLYIGGAFTTVNGQTRQRVAKVNASTGALDGNWTANANASVTALEVTPTTVYAGGDFNTIKSVARTRLASLNTTTGAVNAFAAPVDGRVLNIKLAPNGSRLLISGSFDNVNGVLQGAIASLDPTTGVSRPWAATGIIPRPGNGGCTASGEGLIIQGTIAYVTAEADQAGCWEGIYAANIADGSVVWQATCAGAGQALAIVGGWLYKASHLHDCGRTPGGFVGPRAMDDFIWYRLNAFRVGDGAEGHWFPNTNGDGTEHVGPQALATDGTQLFVGGDFTSVNGTAQRGLTRFSPAGANSAPTIPLAPSAVATSPNTVSITVPATWDREDGTLTYSVFRDGATTAIATAQLESWPWTLPTLRFTDTNVPAGNHTYRVRASDGTTTTALSPVSNTVTASAAAPAAFESVVNSATPSAFWRLNGGGNPSADSSGNGRTATFEGGVTAGVPGATAGNTAVALDGSSGYLRSTTPITVGTTFSQSIWINTTTRIGGDLLGLSDSPTGAGTVNDRVLWMDNNGQVAFGQRSTARQFPLIRSRNALNDGRWHQVVVTYDGTNMELYVDGVPSRDHVPVPAVTTPINPGTVYLRAGYTNLVNFYSVFGRNYNGLPAPTSYFFNGSIDEITFDDSVLTPAQVAAQYGAALAAPGTGTTTTTTSTSTTTSTTTSTSTTSTSTTTTTTVPGGSAYAATVAADSPSLFWRLGEASGATAADSSGNGATGTYRSPITYGAAGAIAGDPSTAITAPGSSGVAYRSIGNAPSTYSLELWFRSTSTQGGKLIGAENIGVGWGTSYDRQIYQTNNGRLAYGIVAGGVRQVITSTASFNNGAWHHVVATQGAAGMALYVDGVSVGTNPTVTPDAYGSAFWRVGGGNLTGWANQPSASALAATVDEVAIYPTALSAARVAAHRAAGL